MRIVAAMVAASLAVGAGAQPAKRAAKPAAAASKPELKPFEFKGYVAGGQLNAEQLAGCETKGVVVECRATGPVGGVEVPYYIKAYKGRMTGLSIILLNSENLTDIALAFMQKYGHTCETGKETWESARGVKLENTTLTWCFKTGKLVVKQYGVRIDVPWIEYSDDHSAPIEKPPVDF